MKVVVLTGWYPNDIYFEDGLSVKNQVQMLSDVGLDINVINISLTWQWLLKGRFTRTRSSYRLGQVLHYSLHGPFGWKKDLWSWRYYNSIVYQHLLSYIDLHGTPDVIHVHNHLVGLAAVRAKKELKIPFIYTEHSTDFLGDNLPFAHNAGIQDILMEAFYPAGVSAALATAMANRANCIVHTLPNFFDPQIFKHLPPTEERNISAPRLITVCTLIRRKQVDVLLRVFASVIEEWPGATLTIVGYGTEEATLKQLTENLKISNTVTFTGPLDQHEVAQSLMASDLFVSASRLETFGMMYVEALACGIPVVAWDSIGIRDIIKHPILGEVVSGVEEFTQAICRQLDRLDPINSSAISKWAQVNFGKEAIVTRHLELYQQAMKESLP